MSKFKQYLEITALVVTLLTSFLTANWWMMGLRLEAFLVEMRTTASVVAGIQVWKVETDREINTINKQLAVTDTRLDSLEARGKYKADASSSTVKDTALAQR